jgi:hypothetical protein
MDNELLHGKNLDFHKIKVWLFIGCIFGIIIFIGVFKQVYFLIQRMLQ